MIVTNDCVGLYHVINNIFSKKIDESDIRLGLYQI